MFDLFASAAISEHSAGSLLSDKEAAQTLGSITFLWNGRRGISKML